jgi:hypothetical protein
LYAPSSASVRWPVSASKSAGNMGKYGRLTSPPSPLAAFA